MSVGVQTIVMDNNVNVTYAEYKELLQKYGALVYIHTERKMILWVGETEINGVSFIVGKYKFGQIEHFQQQLQFPFY